MNIDEQANDIRHMFEARLITRKEYGELIRKLEHRDAFHSEGTE